MFTREAVEQSIALSNGDAEHLEQGKLLNGKVVIRALDTPDGKDVMMGYIFEKGKVVEHEYEDEDAPSELRGINFRPGKDGLVRITASYQTFVRLEKGEIEPADAFDSPDYQVEGSKLMLMPLMHGINSFTRVVRRMPKEY